jgi:hypothetical protein
MGSSVRGYGLDDPAHVMKFAQLKSVGHNISDSFASGIGLMVGIFEMDVFAEAAGEPSGFVVVDFLAGSTSSTTVSADCRECIRFYRDALPDLCAREGIDVSAFRTLQARFGTDVVYGRHYTVTVESIEGKRSVDRYLGVPGRRLRQRR